MTDKNTKEYQDQQTKEALKKRDANVKKNAKERAYDYRNFRQGPVGQGHVC